MPEYTPTECTFPAIVRGAGWRENTLARFTRSAYLGRTSSRMSRRWSGVRSWNSSTSRWQRRWCHLLRRLPVPGAGLARLVQEHRAHHPARCSCVGQGQDQCGVCRTQIGHRRAMVERRGFEPLTSAVRGNRCEFEFTMARRDGPHPFARAYGSPGTRSAVLARPPAL